MPYPESLIQIQEDFQNYLITPVYHGENKNRAPMLSHVKSDYGLAAEERIEIYYDMYRQRLLEVLQADYPKLNAVMGEAYFTSALLHYLLKFPSQHFSVRWFGKDLAHFLSDYAPFCHHLFYAEMAKFEWAMNLTHDCEDKPIIKMDDLKQIQLEEWVELIFEFHPSVQLLTFHYNIPETWLHLEKHKITPTHEEGSTIEYLDEAAKEKFEVENIVEFISEYSTPKTWMMWREFLTCKFKTIGPEQYLMLEAIKNGESFGDICEKLTKFMKQNEVPSFAILNITEWVQSGILC